jgi:hypothetical protein
MNRLVAAKVLGPDVRLDALNRDSLSTMCRRRLLIDEQLPQFQFGSKQVLEGVLIQFLKKGLDRFRHCRAQCATGCDPAVALWILAFHQRDGSIPQRYFVQSRTLIGLRLRTGARYGTFGSVRVKRSPVAAARRDRR